MKRSFDVVVAGIVLVVTSPLLVLSAALVELTSRGPVLYRAPRAGVDGQRFDMFKFRTMTQNRDSSDRRVTEPDDDRITMAGKLLRGSRLDELPQLINVLRGQMSIVGPRPEDIDIVANHYTDWHRRSLTVRPGIACLSEIRWYPDLTHHDPPPPEVPMQDWYVERHLDAQVSESLRYIDEWSPALDLRILARLAAFTTRYAFSEPPMVAFTPISAGSPDPISTTASEAAT